MGEGRRTSGPTRAILEPGEYYASGSGADSGAGKARFSIQARALRTIILPYVTGPYARRQSIEVRDAATGEIVWTRSPLAFSHSWSLARIRVPEGTDAVVLEATDAGSETDEWLGIATPRQVIE